MKKIMMRHCKECDKMTKQKVKEMATYVKFICLECKKRKGLNKIE